MMAMSTALRKKIAAGKKYLQRSNGVGIKQSSWNIFRTSKPGIFSNSPNKQSAVF